MDVCVGDWRGDLLPAVSNISAALTTRAWRRLRGSHAGPGCGASDRFGSGGAPIARVISASNNSLTIGLPSKPDAPTAAARGLSFSGSPAEIMMYLALPRV